MAAYLPDQRTMRSVALDADLRNTQPQARELLLKKIDDPPSDWDARAVLGVPGPVWSVSSETCETGRLSAPDNVAFDHLWREFVYRQPRNARELGAVMSADSEEVFSCYRFDGLSRWTRQAVQAWWEDADVLIRYADATVREGNGEVPEGLAEYASYLKSEDFRDYVAALMRHLDGVNKSRA